MMKKILISVLLSAATISAVAGDINIGKFQNSEYSLQSQSVVSKIVGPGLTAFIAKMDIVRTTEEHSWTSSIKQFFGANPTVSTDEATVVVMVSMYDCMRRGGTGTIVVQSGKVGQFNWHEGGDSLEDRTFVTLCNAGTYSRFYGHPPSQLLLR